MIITKQNTYEVLEAISDKPVFIFGNFMEVRKKHGLSTKKWERCFACNHNFDDDENVYFGVIKGEGNIFFCKECAEKYSTETEKTEVER